MSQKKLRVGFITPSLYWGGAERWMLDLARLSGHALDWVGCACVSPQFADDTMIDLFDRLMPVYQSGREAVEQLMPEAEVIVAWGAYDLAALVAGFDRPVVFVGHGSGRFDRNAASQAVPGATHYAAVARASLEPFEGLVPLERIEVLHNGIDPARCEPLLPRAELRRRLKIAPDEFCVGYVGRVVPEKDPVAVARAVALLPERFRALFVGGGWAVADQWRQIRQVLGERAVLVDRVEDVGSYYRAADCFALLSPREGFSMGMLEAMVCGLPCVLTNVGVLPELEAEHGRHWESVRHGEDHAAAAAIRRLAEMSPADLAARAARCRAIVESRYLASHMAARWIDYLQRIVAAWPGPAAPEPAEPANTSRRTRARNAVARHLAVPRWRAAQIVARLDDGQLARLDVALSAPRFERAAAVAEICGELAATG